MINLKAEYRTREGWPVRALQSFYHEIKGCAIGKEMIKGQVKMKDAMAGGRVDWVWQCWEASGKHQFACAFEGYIHPLDLVEIPKPVIPQVELFRRGFVPHVVDKAENI